MIFYFPPLWEFKGGLVRAFLTTSLVVSSLAAFAMSAFAADLKLSKGHVEFLAIGKPSAIKIRGKGDALQSSALQFKDGKLSGHFVFDLSSLDTGIDMRNEHMKEKYLEVGKYKNAELELTPLDFAQDICKTDVKQDHTAFAGTLKLHGVEKPVKGEFDMKPGHSQASFNLNLTDYKIEIPVYLGIKVADQVATTVELDWSCAQ